MPVEQSSVLSARHKKRLKYLVPAIGFVVGMAFYAVPHLYKYLRSAKVAEAQEMLDLIKKGAEHYYSILWCERDTDRRIPCQFPNSVAITPPGRSCCDPKVDRDGDGRCDVNAAEWNDPSWQALKFAIFDQHFFQYAVESSGTFGNAKITATAFGDLDCNGHIETFQMQLTGDPKSADAECDLLGYGHHIFGPETE